MEDYRRVTVHLLVDGVLLFGTQCGGAEPYKEEYFDEAILNALDQGIEHEGDSIKVLKLDIKKSSGNSFKIVDSIQKRVGELSAPKIIVDDKIDDDEFLGMFTIGGM